MADISCGDKTSNDAISDLAEEAKAYILYREQRRNIREMKTVEEETLGMVEQYIKELDWEIRENANMAYSLQGLNQYGRTYIIKKNEFIYDRGVKSNV